jgi:hypothetical protein
MKVHTMFVIGRLDLDVHGKGNLGATPRAEAIAEILQSIRERRAQRFFVSVLGSRYMSVFIASWRAPESFR